MNALRHLREKPEELLAPEQAEPEGVVAHLVALTGLSPTTFERGLYWPGDHAYETRYACTRCTTGRSIPETVMIGAVHGISVCLKHQRWLSYAHGMSAWRQFSIADMPEMIAAGRRHHNLVRRHGRRRVLEAEQIAFECIADWSRIRGMMPQGLYDRYDQLRASGRDDTEAAAYPSVMALAAVIASPYWLDLARTPAGVERIVDRVAADVTDKRPRGSHDPFLGWLFWQQRGGFNTSEILLVPPTHISTWPSSPFWQGIAPLLWHLRIPDRTGRAGRRGAGS
ncbi:hypothetical protein [Promicromonospora sukumoe]|uniref:TniQ protein n=1 Tax=Promicromonospora sukumoe TaxID=88382 RepID=A0A7W3J859_9MICO|nr:hypothetical protein [Promicromonospora sukumoe]MBA8808060.1 hypothetical protein [Promicromonospora sukumoe]